MIRRPRRWAVFISGRGSNLQALLDAGDDARISLVISSKASAPGVARARRAGVPTEVWSGKIDWAALDRRLRERGIEALFLAGFMKMLPESFVAAWEGRILNVHPSLLPAYPGLDSMRRAFDEGAAVGATVHVVTPEMDAGPRLLRQTCLPAEAKSRGTSFETAQLRLSRSEHLLVREAVRRWA